MDFITKVSKKGMTFKFWLSDTFWFDSSRLTELMFVNKLHTYVQSYTHTYRTLLFTKSDILRLFSLPIRTIYHLSLKYCSYKNSTTRTRSNCSKSSPFLRPRDKHEGRVEDKWKKHWKKEEYLNRKITCSPRVSHYRLFLRNTRRNRSPRGLLLSRVSLRSTHDLWVGSHKCETTRTLWILGSQHRDLE